MSESQIRKFHFRSLITFSIVLTIVVLASSGLILFITPPGRVANWSNWAFLGLTKHQWQSVHTIFSFLFIMIAGFHLYYNWRVLISYLRTKIDEGMKKKREFAISLSAITVVLVLTILNVPPFQTVMNLGEDFKNSWVASANEPPIPHAELLTLADFSEKVKIPIATLIDRLSSQKITVKDTQITMAALAEQNNLSPQQLYQKMGAESNAGGKSGRISEGGGFGRKTVLQVCEQYQVSVADGLKRLKDKSVEATATSNIRELAQSNNLTPIEIVKIICGESTP